MRRSISLLCGVLALGWAIPAAAGEGPPVQRPSGVEAAPVEAAPVEAAPVEAAPVELAPVELAPVELAPVELAPVESEPNRLPSYTDAPIVLDEPPEQPRDRPSEHMIIAGGVTFCAGTAIGLGSITLWIDDLGYYGPVFGEPTGPEPTTILASSVGASLIVVGASLLGVGVTRYKRFKKRLAGGPARVQLQPTIGFGQLGIAGRF